MAELHVYLENGFDHDLVTISVDDEEHTSPDVSTRYQVGLAAMVELSGVELDAAGTAIVRVELCRSGVSLLRLTVDPAATPYVRVDVSDGAAGRAPGDFVPSRRLA